LRDEKNDSTTLLSQQLPARPADWRILWRRRCRLGP
jgi:hypothetical protein